MMLPVTLSLDLSVGLKVNTRGNWVWNWRMFVTRLLTFTAKRQDEDYDEQVEETLQDEVSIYLWGFIFGEIWIKRFSSGS